MIEAISLTKKYGGLTAVDDLSFTVEPGQVLGFLGPNGAGKSTTMKMLTGFLAPTAGSARIKGMTSPSIRWRPDAAWATCPRGRPVTAR